FPPCECSPPRRRGRREKRKRDSRGFLRLDGQNSTSARVGRPEFQFGRKRKVGSLQIRGVDGRLLTDPRDGHTSTLLQVRGYFRADRDGSLWGGRGGFVTKKIGSMGIVNAAGAAAGACGRDVSSRPPSGAAIPSLC